MFTKTGNLHLTYLFPIITVVRVLDSQPRSPAHIAAGWLEGQLILSSSPNRLNE